MEKIPVIQPTLLASNRVVVLVRRRPRLGRRLVQFACAVTAAVVGYSAFLALPTEDSRPRSLAHAAREASDLDLACRSIRQFNQDKDDLSVRLLHGRADLPATLDALSCRLADRLGMLRDEISRAFPGVRCDPEEKPDPGRELPWAALTPPV